MKKRVLVFFLAVVMVLLLSACGQKGELKTLRAQVKKYQNELFDANDQIKEKDEKIASLEQEAQNFATEKDSLQKEIDNLKEQNSSTTEKLKVDSSTNSDGQQLMDLMFPVDGKSYIASQSVIFYRDKILSQRVGTGDEIRFISKSQEEVVVDKEKNLKVWVSRSENGLLYSADKPGIKEP